MTGFSFRKGWNQVRIGDKDKCRERLMAAMGVNSRMSFNNWLNGKVTPKMTQARAIEEGFADYGITDVWEEVES